MESTGCHRTSYFSLLAATVIESSRRVAAFAAAAILLLATFSAASAGPLPDIADIPPSAQALAALPDTIDLGRQPLEEPSEVIEQMLTSQGDSLSATPVDSVTVMLGQPEITDEWVPREIEFNPDPSRAVWLSALFPGLGQVYNRRYWKLPIIVGGYLGLAYATNWNNTMLKDYTTAYADLLDKDPSTKSYMDFFSPNVKEESLDRNWLQQVLKSRKNYFRRNRDLCIISMIGVYLLAMVDAYVDASLSHFDITPDLSMDVAPSLIQDGRQRYPSIGLLWAINF